MKKSGLFFILGLACVFLFTTAASAKEPVVVYTSLETEEVVEYLKGAEKDLPDLDIQSIRLSTGELGARMLAEKDNLGMGRNQYGGICAQGHAGIL